MHRFLKSTRFLLPHRVIVHSFRVPSTVFNIRICSTRMPALACINALALAMQVLADELLGTSLLCQSALASEPTVLAIVNFESEQNINFFGDSGIIFNQCAIIFIRVQSYAVRFAFPLPKMSENKG